MHRFFVTGIESGHVSLAPEDAYHASHVLRLTDGDTVTVYYQGDAFLCRLCHVSDQCVDGTILSRLDSTEPSLAITLFQGLPKGEKMDLIVQKSVELGVQRIVPVIMQRCVQQVGKGFDHKLERWRKIAREACKQCGRAVEAEVSQAVELKEIAPYLTSLQAFVMPWEEARGMGPAQFMKTHPDLASLGILIGPEGGIAREEAEKLISLGARPITLGKRILRTETAAIASVSAFLALYGEMEGS